MKTQLPEFHKNMEIARDKLYGEVERLYPIGAAVLVIPKNTRFRRFTGTVERHPCRWSYHLRIEVRSSATGKLRRVYVLSDQITVMGTAS